MKTKNEHLIPLKNLSWKKNLVSEGEFNSRKGKLDNVNLHTWINVLEPMKQAGGNHKADNPNENVAIVMEGLR